MLRRLSWTASGPSATCRLGRRMSAQQKNGPAVDRDGLSVGVDVLRERQRLENTTTKNLSPLACAPLSSLASGSTEGVVARRHDDGAALTGPISGNPTSAMRRPRTGFVTPSPGGPGQPSAGIMTGCLRWLDAAGTKGGGSCPDRGPGSGPVAPGSTAPGTEIAAVARREAPRLRKEGVHIRNGRADRRAIPSHVREGEEGRGIRANPAPAKEYGRRSVGCLKFE